MRENSTKMQDGVNFELLSLAGQLMFIENKYADNIRKRKESVDTIDYGIKKFEEILVKNNVDGVYFYIIDEKPVTIKSLQFKETDSYWETTMLAYRNRVDNKCIEYATCKPTNQITDFSYDGWYTQITSQQIHGGVPLLINQTAAIKHKVSTLLPDFMEQILETFSDYTKTGIHIFRPTLKL